MSASTKPRYRVPVRIVDAEVRLDEFGDHDIADYLRHRGFYVSETSAAPHDQDGDQENVFNPDDLNRIETLAVCGQIEAARAEALALVSEAIGRAL